MASFVTEKNVEVTPATIADSIFVSLPTMTTPSYEQVVIGKRSSYATKVEEFRGIPYGKVNERWKHSTVQSHLPCNIFDATKNGPRCPQPAAPNTTAAFQSHLDFPMDVGESEFDCLNLIITRPMSSSLQIVQDKHDRRLLPIYVYIHGGALAFGAASDPVWDPARLVSRSIETGKPIIVVTVNYRLNIFGFLASSELSALKGCNFGFFDQLTALKWVSRNIVAFGGDPERITVGGQSAGGTSAYTHALHALCMDEEVRLRTCIVQSPAAGLCGPISPQAADDKWDALCQHLGFSDMNNKDRLTKLRSWPAEDLLAIVAELGWEVFTLVEDKSLVARSGREAGCTISASTQSSSNGRNSQQINKGDPLAVILGTTTYEVCLSDHYPGNACHSLTVESKASILVDKVKEICNYDKLGSLLQLGPHHKQLLQLYGIRPQVPKEVLHDGLYRLLTDVLFTLPAHQAFLEFGERDMQRPVRLTSYVFETGNPFAGPFNARANHCVDLIYLFDCFHDALCKVDETEGQNLSHEYQKDSTARRRNTELVDDVQTRFINYIHSDPRDGWSGSSFEHTEFLIYDALRRSNTLDPSKDARFKAMEARIQTVKGMWESAQALVSAVITLTK